jgi:hypothetical protein
VTDLFEPFTVAWAGALQAAISADTDFQTSGQKFTATLLLVLQQERPLAVRLELADGRCSGATIVAPDDTAAKFVFRAPREVWRALAADELDPLTALTRKQIALTGNLAMLLLHQRAIRALLACAQRVPTRF